MYCLTHMCYVCLEKRDKSLININSSLSVNKDIIHIIGYLPFNLGWLKTKRVILICEECCRRLRETYQLQTMCLKNSTLLQNYMDQLNTECISTIDNEAELHVNLDNKEDDMNEEKWEIKVEDEEIFTFTWEPIIEASEEVFVNVEEAFVKEEDTWKMEAVDDEEEPPMNDNFTENSVKETVSKISEHNNTRDSDTDSEKSVHSNTHDTDTNTEISVHSNTHDTDTNTEISVHNNTHDKETDTEISVHSKTHDTDTDSEISVRSNTHDSDTDSDSSGFISKQLPPTNKKKVNAAAKKSYTCTTCSRSFNRQSLLKRHTRVHTGEKPFKCSICGKCFSQDFSLTAHKRIHTDDKPFKCSTCEKCFRRASCLVRHSRIHTGDKPYKCSRCEKCFNVLSNLKTHMLVHSSEKPFECLECDKCFRQQMQLKRHMRTHTGT